jgi:hypothetical protein
VALAAAREQRVDRGGIREQRGEPAPAGRGLAGREQRGAAWFSQAISERASTTRIAVASRSGIAAGSGAGRACSSSAMARLPPGGGDAQWI